jgi:hypothetical protein
LAVLALLVWVVLQDHSPHEGNMLFIVGHCEVIAAVVPELGTGCLEQASDRVIETHGVLSFANHNIKVYDKVNRKVGYMVNLLDRFLCI